MAQHTMKAYFLTAQDARRAMNTLRTMAEVTGPTPLAEPVNGHPWEVDIEVSVGTTERYPQAVLVDQVVGVVQRYNGTLQQPVS